jgi:transcriptional regulator with XRE-family HTH domain
MQDDSMGRRIKQLRKDRGLTQRQIATIFGLTEMAISRWENDHVNIPSKRLIEIAAWFDVPVDDLCPPHEKEEPLHV